jgi:nicotinate-nucleotide adenylyltransferase
MAGARAQRRGLFGGSFDPVHRAHVALAESALHSLALDLVHWVPAGQPWQKARRLADPAHRVAMVERAIAHESRFVLDRIEVDRAGPSLTLNTVQALQALHPGVQWVLLIGQDQYANLHTWVNWRELLARVELGVACRPGDIAAAQAEVLAHPQRVLPLPMLDISSTAVRERVAAAQDISQLVPATVAGYIEAHHLYRT